MCTRNVFAWSGEEGMRKAGAAKAEEAGNQGFFPLPHGCDTLKSTSFL